MRLQLGSDMVEKESTQALGQLLSTSLQQIRIGGEINGDSQPFHGCMRRLIILNQAQRLTESPDVPPIQQQVCNCIIVPLIGFQLFHSRRVGAVSTGCQMCLETKLLAIAAVAVLIAAGFILLLICFWRRCANSRRRLANMKLVSSFNDCKPFDCGQVNGAFMEVLRAPSDTSSITQRITSLTVVHHLPYDFTDSGNHAESVDALFRL